VPALVQDLKGLRIEEWKKGKRERNKDREEEECQRPALMSKTANENKCFVLVPVMSIKKIKTRVKK
jgi:hypothetical protein